MSVTTGMVGGGFYNRNSTPQWAALDFVLPWLEQAIADMHLAASPPTIGIADFGCSEGQNSIRFMQRLVTAFRLRTSRPIQTIHSDLPSNDYDWLLRNLRSEGQSVFANDVFSAVIGGSMYDRLLPPCSIHLAMTFNAIGFLSRRPLDRLRDYILPNGPSMLRGVGTVTSEESTAFGAQALADAESFLRARAAELVPGGKVLMEVFGAGSGARACDGCYDALNDAVLEVLDAGLIDRQGYEAFYQPVYFRQLEELIAPVTAPGGPLASLFHLERAETYEVAVPFVEEFCRTGDVAAYAESYTRFFRAFTEAVVSAAFPVDQDNRVVEEIFARAERLIREHPERYEFRYICVAALLTRCEDHALQ